MGRDRKNAGEIFKMDIRGRFENTEMFGKRGIAKEKDEKQSREKSIDV